MPAPHLLTARSIKSSCTVSNVSTDTHRNYQRWYHAVTGRYLLNHKRLRAIPFIPDGSKQSRLKSVALEVMERQARTKLSDDDIERAARRNERMLRERQI